MNLLPLSFYERPTVDVARDLIGKQLVRVIGNTIITGIITETEAYGFADDPASHTHQGLTKRNKVMFGPVGRSYIYFIYGMYYCLNVVAKEKNVQAGGVLIRSLSSVTGIPSVQSLNGPGNICKALQLTLAHNDIDMTQKGTLYITQGIKIAPEAVHATKRIGISKAQEHLWRFVHKK